jgi:hypothetical protein
MKPPFGWLDGGLMVRNAEISACIFKHRFLDEFVTPHVAIRL